MAKKYEPFRFKQFVVEHDAATMKVGTDAVLIGAWANPGNAKRILDIGTGCGIIALMMAQRTQDDTRIDAIDISPVDAALALENFKKSPWNDKLNAACTPIQQYHSERKYQLIISNPPFFSNSSLPPNKNRTIARHTTSLPLKELAAGVSRLLDDNGIFSVILPPGEMRQLEEALKVHGLFLIREAAVRPRASATVERCMSEFGRKEISPAKEELILMADSNAWSQPYLNLVEDFYPWA